MADGCHAKSGCKGTKKKQQTSRMGEEIVAPRRFFAFGHAQLHPFAFRAVAKDGTAIFRKR